jgi:VWFA-related protein
MRRAICFLGLVLGISYSQAAAQNPGPNHMTIAVAVTDKSGKPVLGLQQQDFTLLDNKQPRTIASFRAVENRAATADPPVEAIVLMDSVNTTPTNVASARIGLTQFLERDGGALSRPTSLAFLTSPGISIDEKSSQDGHFLIGELNQRFLGLRAIDRSAGVYGGYDRLKLSLDSLAKLMQFEVNKPGRKLVVWISPGWSLLSGAGLDLSSNQRDSIFQTVVDYTNGLWKSGITLYQVDPLGVAEAGQVRAIEYKRFLNGVKTARQVEYGNLALQVLATESGGLVINSGNDIGALIARCFEDGNAFYELSFDAAAAQKPNEYHALEVKVDQPGATARTRTGYYAQPDSSR